MMTTLTIVARIEAKSDQIELVKNALIKLIEPTRNEEGCLQYDLHQDNENAEVIQELTIKLSKKLNMGIIVATHDLDYAKQLDEVYKIENTKLQKIEDE